MLAAIEWYQRQRAGALSPCRFFPSCSEYAHDAITLHGTVRGGFLSLRRLLRCRPFGPSGYDPVPERQLDRQQSACCANHSHHEEMSNV
ncbi:MAG: membrane protein insertion efficiency factor YidD [Ilumatobacteraceae bacterium]